MIDPYKILGVSKTASQEEIKKSYRTLVKKLHPDLNPGRKDIEEQFKQLAEAYEYVGTAEARAKFDAGEMPEQRQEQQREQAKSYYRTQQEGGRYSQSFGEDLGSDFFENLFGGANRGDARASRPMRGENHLYKMEVSFKDAALGAEQEIVLPTGKKLLVKIPAGVTAGTKLRFQGQGGLGPRGGQNGDAFVEVTVKPLSGFVRVDKNIEYELPISFQEGLLGAEVKTPTLDGSVMLNIPSGVSTGSRLRIRGKGVGKEGNRGDQIVVLKVVLPKEVTSEFKDAIRNLDQKFHYNPRGES